MLQNTILLGVFAVTAYHDWKEKTICLYAPLITGVFGILLHILNQEHTIGDILGGIAVGATVLLIGWISGECIGFGDGIMLIVSGIYLGFWANLSLFLTALLISGIAALFLLVTKKKGKNDRIPFLPFLFAAYLLYLL